MLDRTVTYYKKRAPAGFVQYLFAGIGLSKEDEQLAWDIRLQPRGNTQYYADLARLPKKLYCERIAHVHKVLMDEIIRLAIVGWQVENQKQ